MTGHVGGGAVVDVEYHVESFARTPKTADGYEKYVFAIAEVLLFER
jgi:hypothetical protein